MINVTHELNEIIYTVGLFRQYKGYHYFLRAVELALEDKECLQYIFKMVYMEIAIEMRQDVRSVEKGIRFFRDKFLNEGGGKVLAQITGSDRWLTERPRTGEFIEIFMFYIESLQNK